LAAKISYGIHAPFDGSSYAKFAHMTVELSVDSIGDPIDFGAFDPW
jgi:hypothetical protein